uniref:Radial spoke protein 3 n=1 Tax=Phaeomonas parva TaxID=124430 RepID=A0A7S1UL06_9STRA|mmetsp:Transcript_724/g.1804  ORF Transcript_724/g.1804 Transcript_724/m.1804 type:complete len:368 (+) Transcript_724:166-1269(+)|eukprot:CAMPEP_0118862730 /NCGR_PEP_ID=MMETSP1163-20130328/7795_1 /TAXON_ID=124430 /ORGANISM="Phaeomonas parva, Strain CCMP2877" /LENGTH=367 /DNA_ID=CAMNT_0006796661 /DNA_START=261 /DNA_END=1364 /DNA_ORIENTATION=+
MQAFTHASEPQPVPLKRQRPKYREDSSDDLSSTNNIMFDRRVVRGNTYAAQVITQAQQREIERLREEDERRRRAEATRRKRGQKRRPSTPPPVPGRVHMDIQTEEYVERLADRADELDAATQTDAGMDKPIPVLFVPKKSGVDKETQILDGDLFDFDFEVAPVLEVLVVKTLENSMMEIMEEAELEAIREQQAAFEMERNAELAEVQRLEAAVQRRADEKHRRIEQKKAKQAELVAMKEKVESRGIAQGYMADLQDRVFDTMGGMGLFFDPLVREVETSFLPWLLDETMGRVDKLHLAQDLAKSLLQESMGKAKKEARAFRKGIAEAEAAKAARIQEELEAKARAEEEERRRLEELAAAEAEAEEEG